VLTAAIVVIVVATSLGLTYEVLRRARLDAKHDRPLRLLRKR
jgi:hypothetical protein